MLMRLGKQVRRVTQLRCFDRDRSGEIEDILAAEKVEPTRPPAELLVEELIVIGLPTDLRDVEVARHTKVPTEAAQLFPFHWFALDVSTNLAQGVRKLAKPVVALTSCFNLPCDVGRNLHLDAARQSGLPLIQAPLTIPALVLARLDERSL